MPDPGLIVYVDRSDIRANKADELEEAARRLVEQVAAIERRALSYDVYFSDDRSRMTVVHVHSAERSRSTTRWRASILETFSRSCINPPRLADRQPSPGHPGTT